MENEQMARKWFSPFIHVKAAAMDTKEVLNGTVLNNLWVTENKSRFRERQSTSIFLTVKLLVKLFEYRECPAGFLKRSRSLIFPKGKVCRLKHLKVDIFRCE
jgi:hypothetical protein